jgi:hypothetical protein
MHAPIAQPDVDLSAQLHEQPLKLFDVDCDVLFRSFRSCCAIPHTSGDQAVADSIERGLAGGELRHNLAAVFALFDHSLHSAHLPLKSSQPLDHIVIDLFRKSHPLMLPPGVSGKLGLR